MVQWRGSRRGSRGSYIVKACGRTASGATHDDISTISGLFRVRLGEIVEQVNRDLIASRPGRCGHYSEKGKIFS